MGVYSGPDLKEDGLVLALDGANYKSFKGEVTTNLIPDPILGQQVVGSGGSGYSVSTDNTIINPFGNNGATKIVVNSSGSGYTRQGGTVNLTAGVTYTFSCFFKNGNVNLSNITNSTLGSTFGIVIQSFSPTYDALEGYFNLVSTTSYPNDWVRKSFTFTPNYTQTYYCSFSTTPSTETAGTYYLYGFQLEQKSYSSSFVAGTRGSTVATGGGWADLIGNGNHGELVNGVREDSANGGSLVFDGTDDYVTTTLGTYTPYCIDIWFYNDDDITSSVMQGNYQNLLGVGSSPGGIALGGWTSAATDETFSFFCAGWPTNGMTYIRDTASPGIHNLVVNWNGSSFDFWLDGTKRVTYASTYGHRTLETVTGFQIGSAYDNANSYEFDGNVYSVKVYTSQLSDSQVQQNFNATRSRFGI